VILDRLLKHQLPSETHMVLVVLVAGIVTFSPLLLGSVSHDLFKGIEKMFLHLQPLQRSQYLHEVP